VVRVRHTDQTRTWAGVRGVHRQRAGGAASRFSSTGTCEHESHYEPATKRVCVEVSVWSSRKDSSRCTLARCRRQLRRADELTSADRRDGSGSRAHRQPAPGVSWQSSTTHSPRRSIARRDEQMVNQMLEQNRAYCRNSNIFVCDFACRK